MVFTFNIHVTSRDKTRIHSSRMRTVRCSGNLSCHACMLPCHACPLHPATQAPCHAHPHHACPLPHMLPAMQATPCHIYPPAMHTRLPCHPLAHHSCHMYMPSAATHASCHACLPPHTYPAIHAPCHARPTCGQTDTCENITFPQLLLRTVKTRTVNEPPSNISNIVSCIVLSCILDFQIV